MTARPQTTPAAVTKIRSHFDFCLLTFAVVNPAPPNGSWVEVACEAHEWQCGHHHRHWGPTARCAGRHQLEVAR